MGGKGKRRREKNYRAAHGGNSRLPPPPDPSSLEALPSKLRKIFAFTNSSAAPPNQSSGKASLNARQKAQRRGNNQLKSGMEAESDSDLKDFSMVPQGVNNVEENVQRSLVEKKRRRRKRKQVDDLRFESEREKLGVISKRQQRRKEYLKAKKKKHKKTNPEENVDFPKHEKIKFGEVVEAPPKLAVIPKAFKTPMDASRERLRLKAVMAYRDRKNWTSRPGIHLPSMTTSSSLQ
ncbi:hypothetical protein Ancab_037762 [Ancistrocladus abbreviatus]